jgi:hypothetical protein
MKITNKFTLVAGLVLGAINFGFSQGSTSIDIATEKLRMSSDASKAISAQGSPYVDKNFLPLKVTGYPNQLFTGRFNAYNGEMEVNLGTKIIALDKRKDYRVTFTQTNKIYRTFSYETEKGISRNGFLAIVNETDSFSVLKEEKIKYYEREEPVSSYQQPKPAKFKKENDIYYLKKGNKVTHLPTKRRSILKAYPKHAKAIKSFIKENKLSASKEADLIRIAQHISTL